MTLREAKQFLMAELSAVYDTREAANITDWVLESLTSLSRVDRIVKTENLLSPAQIETLKHYNSELIRHRPVQYVLHESWFHGLRFYVNEHVLIPRPETEELVNLIIEDHSNAASALRIIDIGTGSGCIPISLKHNLPQATIYACDVSAGALEVAGKNAKDLGTAIQFIQQDILDATLWQQLPEVDIIVSNPPYIPESDQSSMHTNVLEYEPHLALFVSNEDPLTFYRAIAELAQTKLARSGTVYAEIHEDLGPATMQLFSQYGFAQTQLIRDMQGKDRMIKASGLTSR
ncbi:peptide chain release factor N(5)-glutamine methyltransferase [Pseudoflavitalea sp. G-6-1-2]|nr:peptide chain release factor N(5)-glutamine methyltransferase [Pseudoflavitalea sp. G-6-1-2]